MTPYERARADPAFLARFARAYRGRSEPLDALWWQDHPDQTAPSGAGAPTAALAESRRAVYEPRVDKAAAERYRRLRSDLEREREAVLAGIAAAEAGTAPIPVADGGASSAVAGEATPSAPVSRAEPARPGRPLLLALAAVVAAFAVGLLVAPSLGRAAAPRPSASPTPADTAPLISGASNSGSAFGVFSQPQRDVDRPPIGAGARLLPQSFRRLQWAPTSGVTVYAAEDSEGDVCLVALSVEGRLAATCTPIAAFQTAPLRLAFRADRYQDEWTKTGTQVEVVTTWDFPGRFTLDERPVGGQ